MSIGGFRGLRECWVWGFMFFFPPGVLKYSVGVGSSLSKSRRAT